MKCYSEKPLVVLGRDDNHDAAVAVAPGKTIDIIGPAPDDRFLVVIVDGQEFHAFADDVEEQCVPLRPERAIPPIAAAVA